MAPPDDFADARAKMIKWQLKRRGVKCPHVLSAIERVPRERFVAKGWERDAYSDRALPIACGQTISQPYIVALMTEALQLAADHRVLEVGTGSGYQTAVLAELAEAVFSIERHEALSQKAQTRLNQLGYRNVHLKVGDGALGWPSESPFHRIIITAAAPECPAQLWAQLAEGGIVVGPFGGGGCQILQALRKVSGQPRMTSITTCRFVPLVDSSARD